MRRQKAIPGAHLTFVIDCARGKQIPWQRPQGQPRSPGPSPGPAVPPMKTYILLCGSRPPTCLRRPRLGGGPCPGQGPCRADCAPQLPAASPEALRRPPGQGEPPGRPCPPRSSARGERSSARSRPSPASAHKRINCPSLAAGERPGARGTIPAEQKASVPEPGKES